MHQNALIHEDEALGELIPLSAVLVPNYQKFKCTKKLYHYGAFVMREEQAPNDPHKKARAAHRKSGSAKKASYQSAKLISEGD